MTLEQFLSENAWGLVVGGLSLAFSVGTIYTAITRAIKQMSNEVAALRTDMKAQDRAHDELLHDHSQRIQKVEQQAAVLESRLDQTIRHIGEQMDRIYNKLFGGKA